MGEIGTDKQLDAKSNEWIKENGTVSKRLAGMRKRMRQAVNAVNVSGEIFSLSREVLKAYDSVKTTIATKAGQVTGVIYGAGKGLVGLGKLVLWEPLDSQGELIEAGMEKLFGARTNIFGNDNQKFMEMAAKDPAGFAKQMALGLGKQIYGVVQNAEKLHVAQQSGEAGHAFDAAFKISEFIGEMFVDPTIVIGGLGKFAKFAKIADKAADALRAGQKALGLSKSLDNLAAAPKGIKVASAEGVAGAGKVFDDVAEGVARWQKWRAGR